MTLRLTLKFSILRCLSVPLKTLLKKSKKSFLKKKKRKQNNKRKKQRKHLLLKARKQAKMIRVKTRKNLPHLVLPLLRTLLISHPQAQRAQNMVQVSWRLVDSRKVKMLGHPKTKQSSHN